MLRSKRTFAAILSETPENTRNSQSQNTLDPGMAQKYISLVSEEIEGRVIKKLSKEFSPTESRFLGALSKLGEFLLNPQVRTCSVAVPETSSNIDSENREPTGDLSLGNLCPEAMFSACHTSHINDSEQEETHHRFRIISFEYSCNHCFYIQLTSRMFSKVSFSPYFILVFQIPNFILRTTFYLNFVNRYTLGQRSD